MERASKEQLFPIFIKLAGKLCIVVGGGEVAARKVRALLEGGARVRIIAPEICPSLSAMVESGQVAHLARGYEPGDLQGSALVFGATDDSHINEAVSREAGELGIPVNLVDQPELCSFYVPSTIARGPIQLAISTGGESPALARRLRELLEEVITPEYGELASLLGSLRGEVKDAFASGEERERKWRRVLKSEVLSLLKAGKEEEAEAVARKTLGLPLKETKTKRKVRIGTRGSALAQAQAGIVAESLQKARVSVELVTIRTTGDRARAPIGEASVGMFVREIEQALVRGEVDLAVHSLKDLPTGLRPGLVIAAVPPREEPGDAVITRSGQTLAELPAGSRVATASPRRVAQLRAHRPDLVFVPVKGNVDTRLRKLKRGDYDAVVLACAGLARLGRAEEITERLSYDICLPAPGQGALALQVREEDETLRQWLKQFDHAPSRLAVEAERSFLAALGGGCAIAAGALGLVKGDRLVLKGVLEAEEGLVRDQIEGAADKSVALGTELATRMLAVKPNKIAIERR